MFKLSIGSCDVNLASVQIDSSVVYASGSVQRSPSSPVVYASLHERGWSGIDPGGGSPRAVTCCQEGFAVLPIPRCCAGVFLSSSGQSHVFFLTCMLVMAIAFDSVAIRRQTGGDGGAGRTITIHSEHRSFAGKLQSER